MTDRIPDSAGAEVAPDEDFFPGCLIQVVWPLLLVLVAVVGSVLR